MRIITNKNTNRMTIQQETTIDQITKRIEKLNGTTNVGVSKLAQTKHYFLYITKKRVNYGVCEITTVFCDIQINTKGNIVKGKWDCYNPIREEKTFF